MKIIVKIIAALAIIGLLALVPACTTTTQKASIPTVLTNGGVGARTIESKSTCLFQSSQSIDKLSASTGEWNGDRTSFGAVGVKQDSDASKFAETVGAVLVQGMLTYMTGGANQVIPRAQAGQVVTPIYVTNYVTVITNK